MQNLINWFEIPASIFDRAVTFYTAILGLEITTIEMMGTRMGMFPSDGTNVSGAIVHGPDYTPCTQGIVAYLNGGDDLQVILDKIAQNGGTVIVPKTLISPDMGYFAQFIDSEGNKMALHSIH